MQLGSCHPDYILKYLRDQITPTGSDSPFAEQDLIVIWLGVAAVSAYPSLLKRFHCQCIMGVSFQSGVPLKRCMMFKWCFFCFLFLSCLRVDGGVSTNDFVMQLTADLFGRKLSRLQHHEMSCLGAAFVAGLGVGRCTQAHTQHLYSSVPTQTMIFTVNSVHFMLVKTNLYAKDHCSCFEIVEIFFQKQNT